MWAGHERSRLNERTPPVRVISHSVSAECQVLLPAVSRFASRNRQWAAPPPHRRASDDCLHLPHRLFVKRMAGPSFEKVQAIAQEDLLRILEALSAIQGDFLLGVGSAILRLYSAAVGALRSTGILGCYPALYLLL